MPGMESSNSHGRRLVAVSHLLNNQFRCRWLLLVIVSGCVTAPVGSKATSRVAAPIESHQIEETQVALISYQAESDSNDRGDTSSSEGTVDSKLESAGVEATLAIPLTDAPLISVDTLPQLEAIAVSQNPQLRRLAQESEAARAKVGYVDGLPDPTIGGNVFAAPIETAAGSQRANLTIGQMIPWLERLDAQAQQACFEAMALQQVQAAQRLKVIGDVRTLWYRLYVIGQQIQIASANQELLESLIEVANARVSTGKATQGDVLVGTLEYSKLEEQLVTLRQQQVSTVAEINRLLGRGADVSITPPVELKIALPAWNHQMMRQMAVEHQPDIRAARIRTQATRWGLEVARLKRRPDFSVNASWFASDSNRPPSTVVDVGDDAWSVGAAVSIPLWDRKYDAIEREASWKHSASHASVDEAVQRYDSILRDLWEQAKAADETATLYTETILPQAKDTLEADQQSYVNGTVDFDRVIRDVRNLLTLELGYHRARGQLATALARIEQSVGLPL